MELRYLLYFKKVAELQHITHAAEELMIAQPALSKVIRTLEDELHTKLFDRYGKSITLNESGKVLLKYTNEIFDCLDNAQREINLLNMSKNCITLSFNSASVFIPLLAAQFQKEHPDIRIQFAKEDDSSITGLYCKIDSHFNKHRDSKNTVTLIKEKCVLAFSKNHRFAQMEVINPEDMENETFLFSQKNHSIHDIYNYLVDKGRLNNVSIMECVSSETVFSFLEMNLGISYIPCLTWNLPRHPSLKVYSTDDSSLYRTLQLEWMVDVKDNKTAKIFEDFCIEFFAEIEKLSRLHHVYAGDILPYYMESKKN